MALLSSAVKFLNHRAILTAEASYTYRDLLNGALHVAQRLKKEGLKGDARWGPCVGLYLKPSAEYVAATWGTWLANGIAVPLCLSHTAHEIKHVVRDADIPLVLTHKEERPELFSVLQTRFADLGDVFHGERRLDVESLPSEAAGALLLYTSGTTGKPKGALHTHRSLTAQVAGLTEAWELSSEDALLHALPLHHIHGVVVALYAALSNGACVQLLPKFSPSLVWSAIKGGGVTMFMGVPTMYSRLLSFFAEQSTEEQARLRDAARKLRLYVSGSSACPVSIINAWKEVSGHWLLERYGMTEIGMALSNPLHGERRAGFVGAPLPGVSVKVEPPTGELFVKGETLFAEYWRNSAATADAFDSDGYFKTGDIVRKTGNPPCFRILGRQAVDIIKSAGYKLSALEIESLVLEHPEVKECSVIGLPDDTYGEIVVAIVVLGASGISNEALFSFCGRRLAPYKLPRRFVRLKSIPRNAMGKVNKAELKFLVASL